MAAAEFIDPDDIPFGELKKAPRKKPIYAVVWTWRSHRVCKTKKRALEKQKVWKRWYERNGWKVVSHAAGCFATSQPRVVHNKREPFDVYIGRPSKWGNPFSHKDGTLAEFKVVSRDEAIRSYGEWIKTQPDLLAALPELQGKTLGCWCAPERCHGEVLAELAGNVRHAIVLHEYDAVTKERLK